MWYWILIVVVYSGSGGRADLRMIETYRKEQCIAAGEEFSTENIRIIRPGNGLAPKYYDILLGKKAACAIKRATPINWDWIE